MQKITKNDKVFYLTDVAAVFFENLKEEDFYSLLHQKELNLSMFSEEGVISTWLVKNEFDDVFLTASNVCSILSILEADPKAPMCVLKNYLNDKNISIYVSQDEKTISFIPHMIGGYTFASNKQIPRDILEYLLDTYITLGGITIEQVKKGISKHCGYISCDLVPYQKNNRYFLWKVIGINLSSTDSMYKKIENILPLIYELKDSGMNDYEISRKIQPNLSLTSPVKVNSDNWCLSFLHY